MATTELKGVTSSPRPFARAAQRPPRKSWRVRSLIVLVLAALMIYLLAIGLDLPSPAGSAYRQDLPASELANWGASLQAQDVAATAAHWWDKAQALRGWSVYPEGWAWPKLTPAPVPRWLPLIVLGILAIPGIHWLEGKSARRAPWLALTALVAFAYGLQLGTLWLKAPNVEELLVERVTSVDFTGYLTSAFNTPDLSAFFAGYSDTVHSSTWCNHCRTHPPGPVLVYWLALHGLDRLPAGWLGAAVGMLPITPYPNLPPSLVLVAAGAGQAILLTAASFVIPIYGLARRLAGARLALSLAALGAVVPAMVLMSPEFDQLYGTLAAVLCYLVVRALQERRFHIWWGLSTGVFFAFCSYWSFGMLILAGPAVLLILGAVLGLVPTRVPLYNAKFAAARLRVRAGVGWLVGFGSGAVVPWLLMWLLTGFHLLTVFRQADQAQLGGITAVRPFAPWLVFNLVDYLQFLGLPLAFAALLTVIHQEDGVLNVFGLLFWAMLLLLDLTGATRAEVSRLWIPLTPLALMGIFYAAGRRWLRILHLRLLLVAQFAVCVLIGGNWLTP